MSGYFIPLELSYLLFIYGVNLPLALSPECSNCHLPKFLYGKKPTTSHSPAVYAVIHSCHSSPVRTSRHVTTSYSDNFSGRERLSLRLSEQDFAADAPLGTSAPAEHSSPLPFPQAPSTAPSTQAHARNIVSTSPAPANIQVVPSTRGTRSDNDNRPYYDNRNDNPPAEEGEGITSNSNYTESHNYPNLYGEDSTPRPLTSTVVSVLNSTNHGMHKSSEKIATTFALSTLSDRSEGAHSYHLNHNGDDQLSTQRPVRTRKREISEESQVFTVTYWMFYPYNHGKDVCTINLGYYLGRMYKPPVNGSCFGEEVAMGKHVGDWEHVSIQFRVCFALVLFYICAYVFSCSYFFYI